MLAKIYPFRKLGKNVYFHGLRNEKKIALTFDDGPSNQTLDVLKVLKKYKANGTFFFLGKKVGDYKKIVEAVVESGCEIGNHSYSHAKLIFKSRKAIFNEIDRTDQELKGLGVKTSLFRPPHGIMGFGLFLVAKGLNKKTIFWDVGPKDWRMEGVNIVVNRIVKRIKPGSIVDLHNYAEGIGDNKDLPKILEKTIPLLRKKGYSFANVSEIL